MYKSAIVLALASGVDAAVDAWSCASVRPQTQYSSGSWNVEDMMGNWVQVQRPNDVPFVSDTRYGCSHAQFSWRAEGGWRQNRYPVSLNFQALNLDTNELWSMSDNAAESFLITRTDNTGDTYTIAKGMGWMTGETEMQVLLQTNDLLVFHTCANMVAGVMHWSGAVVFKRNSASLTDAERDQVNSVIDGFNGSVGYTSAILIDTYHGSECKYHFDF